MSLTTEARRHVAMDYEKKLSCLQCHSGVPSGQPDGADVPPPLPVDKETPGLERKRRCDYTYTPMCGPCDGLGGPRTGDGVHEFTPMPCEVMAFPSEVNASERVLAAYPMKAAVHIIGDSRIPLAMAPDGQGIYVIGDINATFGWDDHEKMARFQYVFNEPEQLRGMSATYMQTYEQMKTKNSPGVKVTVLPNGKCSCEEAPAGVLHVHAFMPHDEYDVIDLPGDKGGLEYLGRVKISPFEDGTGRTVIADHFLKNGFNVLVDAGKESPTYGRILRTFIPYGVRQVLKDWQLEDPTIKKPDIWKIPSGCDLSYEPCKMLLDSQTDVPFVV